MNILVTGGAGFIGSHLVDSLAEKNNVTVYDNLSTGKKEFIQHQLDKIRFIEADLLDTETLGRAMKNQDFVYHIAANADVRHGADNTGIDLEQNTIATHNVLEAMRRNSVRKIAFSSSSVVYGEAKTMPTPECYGPLIPISLYGASKLAGEALITSYCHTFDMQAWIFRFANIIGNRTHGVIADFINKLRQNPKELEILGNGRQTKSYMLAEECVDAMLYVVKHATENVNIFNLGTGDHTNVKRIGEIVIEEMGLKADMKFTGGDRGWKGDIPVSMLDVSKLNRLGWKAKTGSENAIRKTVKCLLGE